MCLLDNTVETRDKESSHLKFYLDLYPQLFIILKNDVSVSPHELYPCRIFEHNTINNNV